MREHEESQLPKGGTRPRHEKVIQRPINVGDKIWGENELTHS